MFAVLLHILLLMINTYDKWIKTISCILHIIRVKL